jgi:hypothetical protein
MAVRNRMAAGGPGLGEPGQAAAVGASSSAKRLRIAGLCIAFVRQFKCASVSVVLYCTDYSSRPPGEAGTKTLRPSKSLDRTIGSRACFQQGGYY